MKSWLSKAVSGILLVAGVLLGGGVAVSAAHATVNDFRFSSMHATYLLGVNATGHSTLTTIEKLVAVFPQSDQNHGIQRAIPTDYNGHGTDLTLESVEDADGVSRAYTTEIRGGFLVVTIAEDGFVHGAQTYVLTYTQVDVTLTPSNGGGNQEFYWDVNGTGWSQPFDSVEAVVMMPGWIAQSLTGKSFCYQGVSQSNVPCAGIDKTDLGSTARFTAMASTLAPGENLTIAIEFAPKTFVERQTNFFASPWAFSLVVFSALGLGILAVTLVLRGSRWRDNRGRGIVIAEYGPPPGMTPLLASNVYGRANRTVAAAILNLAVAGNIRILDERLDDNVQAAGRRLFGAASSAGFTLELISAEGVSGEERELLEAVFGDECTPGSQRGLGVVDSSVTRKIAKLRTGLRKTMQVLGYRGKIGRLLPSVLVGVAFVSGLTAVYLAIAIAQAGFGGSIPFLLAMLNIVSSLLTLVFSVSVHPLTEKGAALKDHLRGLRTFIELAEADRLRVLQSPSGALRIPVDVTDARLRLKLTEKVLPYSVLFGLEKDWGQELANLYADNDVQPSWYVGPQGFNVLVFSAALGSFATAVNSSWAASSSSSAMGGSGGGGFSGGGGGGGGGGGV